MALSILSVDGKDVDQAKVFGLWSSTLKYFIAVGTMEEMEGKKTYFEKTGCWPSKREIDQTKDLNEKLQKAMPHLYA